MLGSLLEGVCCYIFLEMRVIDMITFSVVFVGGRVCGALCWSVCSVVLCWSLNHIVFVLKGLQPWCVGISVGLCAMLFVLWGYSYCVCSVVVNEQTLIYADSP